MDFPIRRITPHFALSHPPKALYAEGDEAALGLLEKLPARGLAVVGTRAPQPRAEIFVRNTLRELAGSGLVILSGLALGIDAAAHAAALEAGLPTVALLGCGIQHQYPRENTELRRKILEAGGLILSEYEPDELARPHYFLWRNRLIAGLARATWIAQAPLRSGTLNTAYWARIEQRDTYVTPCFPGDPAFAGSQALLDGQHAHSVWNAESFGSTWLELATWYQRKKRRKPGRNPASPPLSGSDASHAANPLLEQVRCHTAHSGGMSCTGLLDWAIAQGSTPLEFYAWLQKTQQCGLLRERGDWLAAL